MLVKKIDPEWFPAENNGLQVGQTIEMTDPRSLIESGTVVAIDANGLEVSSYELYGTLDANSKKEFQEFLEWKKIRQQKEINARFQQENEELKKQLLETAKTPTESTETNDVPTDVGGSEAVAEPTNSNEAVTETKPAKTMADATKAKRLAALAKARAAKNAKKG
jgi:hypothetical protein